MNCICSIEKGEIIFRYDLDEPPCCWDINYKSKEYNSNRFQHPKNMAGNFFFFSNEDVTKNTALEALKRQVNQQMYWFTTAKVNRDLILLNLCGGNVFQNILKMHELGLDIFSDNLKFYHIKDMKSFSDLKEPFFEFKDYIKGCQIDDIERATELIKIIESPFRIEGCPFGLLGQILTDFENGLFFCKLLEDRGYDGYVFDESKGGHTICLRRDVVTENPSALSEPKKQCVFV